MNAEVALLLRAIDEAFDQKSWHGTNLRGSIRGLTAAEAQWRPAAGRHSIQEIVVHCAYWKYAVRRRLTGEKRGSFPLKGSDWFARAPGNAGWRQDITLLEDEHAKLKAAAGGLRVPQLSAHAPGSTVPFETLLRGIAAHDLYHAGQIQLIKRLQRAGKRSR